MRDLKDKVTECEVGTREARTDSQRILGSIKREEGDHKSKIEDLCIEKGLIIEARREFELSSVTQTGELRDKLRAAQENLK